LRTSDPTHRVSGLAAANRKPASVKPESLLQEATTIMQMNGYSRLPVMRNERDVAGIVTWQSIGTRLALGRECTHVRQCMEPIEVIPETTRLFDAIRVVSRHGYVLVRGADRTITGMVTETDLTHQLGQFAGPFLFVGEIEGHLRNLIHGKFTPEELQAVSVGDKPVEGSSDLTFGGFCRLLENPDNWERLNLGVDRAEFAKRLNAVREMRNDLMHFNPDGIGDEHRATLRNVARFFDQLTRAIAA
jgi:CBS domain-containing protein